MEISKEDLDYLLNKFKAPNVVFKVGIDGRELTNLQEVLQQVEKIKMHSFLTANNTFCAAYTLAAWALIAQKLSENIQDGKINLIISNASSRFFIQAEGANISNIGNGILGVVTINWAEDKSIPVGHAKFEIELRHTSTWAPQEYISLLGALPKLLDCLKEKLV